MEKAPEGDYKTDLTQFVSQELTKSDRPELTSAKNIVSGGIHVFFLDNRLKLDVDHVYLYMPYGEAVPPGNL